AAARPLCRHRLRGVGGTDPAEGRRAVQPAGTGRMTARLRPGSVFAGYVIERVLGSGGMGTVYAARHPRLPRWDALKVLGDTHSASAEFRARFVREAELAARIDHPNVVAVHDRGIDDGALWIA